MSALYFALFPLLVVVLAKRLRYFVAAARTKHRDRLKGEELFLGVTLIMVALLIWTIESTRP